MKTSDKCSLCERAAVYVLGVELLCASCADDAMTTGRGRTRPMRIEDVRSSSFTPSQSDPADEAHVDERCAAIARELLGFDPRSSGVELRAVNPLTLQAALIVAFRAGRADEGC